MTVFISYRREPDQYVAGHLSRDLRAVFGESQVIRDKESIAGGVSWKQYVLKEIGKCSVLLVLIGKDWSNVRDTSGARRLDKLDDPLRLEIGDAIRDGASIIPLLLEDAQMPAAAELPPQLVMLAELKALDLRDGDWEEDVARLVQRLESLGTKRIGRMARRIAISGLVASALTALMMMVLTAAQQLVPEVDSSLTESSTPPAAISAALRS
jgi:hypothetical protein